MNCSEPLSNINEFDHANDIGENTLTLQTLNHETSTSTDTLLENKDDSPSVNTITPLPNGHILIGEYHGILYDATIDTPSLNSLKHHLKDITRKASR